MDSSVKKLQYNWAAIAASITLILLTILFVVSEIIPQYYHNICEAKKDYTSKTIPGISGFILSYTSVILFILGIILKIKNRPGLKFDVLLIVDAIIILIIIAIGIFLSNNSERNPPLYISEPPPPQPTKDNPIEISREQVTIFYKMETINIGVYNVLNQTIFVKPIVKCSDIDLKTESCYKTIESSDTQMFPLLIYKPKNYKGGELCRIQVIDTNGNSLGYNKDIVIDIQ